MNAARRKMLADAIKFMSVAKETIELAIADEQIAYDNMPESFQNSERGEEMDENIWRMQDIVDSIDEHISELQEM